MRVDVSDVEKETMDDCSWYLEEKAPGGLRGSGGEGRGGGPQRAQVEPRVVEVSGAVRDPARQPAQDVEVAGTVAKADAVELQPPPVGAQSEPQVPDVVARLSGGASR